jgi:hypothetical protein
MGGVMALIDIPDKLHIFLVAAGVTLLIVVIPETTSRYNDYKDAQRNAGKMVTEYQLKYGSLAGDLAHLSGGALSEAQSLKASTLTEQARAADYRRRWEKASFWSYALGILSAGLIIVGILRWRRWEARSKRGAT